MYKNKKSKKIINFNLIYSNLKESNLFHHL